MPDLTRVNALAAFALLIAASPAQPTVSPIHAEFVESELATHYTVTAEDPSGKSLTYQWHLIPPANDAGCNHFSATGNTAVWHHGDQDGCSQNVQVVQGEPGTVVVVVTNGDFSCTATYFGTITGNGAAAACRQLAQATPSAPATPTAGATPANDAIPAWQIAVVVLVFLAVAGSVGWFLLARDRGV